MIPSSMATFFKKIVRKCKSCMQKQINDQSNFLKKKVRSAAGDVVVACQQKTINDNEVLLKKIRQIIIVIFVKFQ